MLEAVPGTIYIAKCTRKLFCRYKSDQLHVGSTHGLTEVDNIPVGCMRCGVVMTVNARSPRAVNNCPNCLGKLEIYIKTGLEPLDGTYSCPKCNHQSLIFEIIGFLK